MPVGHISSVELSPPVLPDGVALPVLPARAGAEHTATGETLPTLTLLIVAILFFHTSIPIIVVNLL